MASESESTQQGGFDLEIPALRRGIHEAVGQFSLDEVQEIVACIFTGGNYRTLTEKPTRQAISIYHGWTLRTCHRAKAEFGDLWLTRLLDLTGRRGEPHAGVRARLTTTGERK